MSNAIHTLNNTSACYDISFDQEILPIPGVRYDHHHTFPHNSHPNKFEYIPGPMSNGEWSERPCCN